MSCGADITIGGETGAHSAFEAATATDVVARIRVALASLNIVPSADGQLLNARIPPCGAPGFGPRGWDRSLPERPTLCCTRWTGVGRLCTASRDSSRMRTTGRSWPTASRAGPPKRSSATTMPCFGRQTDHLPQSLAHRLEVAAQTIAEAYRMTSVLSDLDTSDLHLRARTMMRSLVGGDVIVVSDPR